MSGHRYERVLANDEDDHIENTPSPQITNNSRHQQQQQLAPESPPPSFRSRASSFAHPYPINDRDHLVSDADRTLRDTFDSPDGQSDDESENPDHRLDDRQRVLSGRPSVAEGAEDTEQTGMLSRSNSGTRAGVERRVTELPAFPPATNARSGRTYGGGSTDGVFANLGAKLAVGEEVDEKPPTYEQAAADAAPPYWENTIFAPGSANSDEVYIDGLPVGSVFSFIWNAMISMSFQLVGFLLTYLLHTTHAAKNGSKAGLGITLIQYGFTLKGAGNINRGGSGVGVGVPADGSGGFTAPPSDPNSHDFDPNAPEDNGGFDAGTPPPTYGFAAMQTSDWFAYGLMIVGWFIVIKSSSDYFKARRHEQLVLQSPTRGLNVPVVAEGETPETSV